MYKLLVSFYLLMVGKKDGFEVVVVDRGVVVRVIRSQKKKSKVSRQGTRPLPLRYSSKRLKTKRGEAETCETCPFCSNRLAELVEGSYLTMGGEESIESQEVSINKASQQTKI
jgi:hypothetical protein